MRQRQGETGRGGDKEKEERRTQKEDNRHSKKLKALI